MMMIAERLAEFYRRLKEQPRSTNADEALVRIGKTLCEVEDELSGIPAQPLGPQPNPFDGRMYPPHPLFVRRNPDGSLVAHQASHRVEIGANGSIKIFRVDRKGNPPAPPLLELDVPGGTGS
jgi:hypothetical protein